MWQAAQRFLATPLAKFGGAAIKVWHLIAVGAVVTTTVAAGTYIYVRQHQTSASDQRVVVFIGGLNTTLNGQCLEETFFESLREPLVQTAGLQNPYANGCNRPAKSYLQASTSMALYSYTGGHMDSDHGVWIPNAYDPCNVDNLTLQSDVQGFDHMLDQYRKVYPNARFTIVGHSLGGLVALQGAYDYAVALRHSGVIDRVLTIDSPLGGVRAPVIGQFLANVLSHTCSLSASGLVVNEDILPLGEAANVISPLPLAERCQQPQVGPGVVLSSCAGLALTHAGTSVVTLGNAQDALYCTPNYQAFRDVTCQTQLLSSVDAPILTHLYDVAPLSASSADPFPGHGAILQTTQALQDIVREILAPVVTISQPQAAGKYGTDVPLDATVRCVWGNASHTSAQVAAAGVSYFAGAGISTGSSDTLAIKGLVRLPPTAARGASTFSIDATSDACHYPTVTDVKELPTKDSYVGGPGSPLPITISSEATVPTGSSGALPTPSQPRTSALLLARTPDTTGEGKPFTSVAAGTTFTVYVDFQNTGTTAWTDAGDFQLGCATTSAPTQSCMSGQPVGLGSAQIRPGEQATWYLSLTAPDTPGVYTTVWNMMAGQTAIGARAAAISVNVTAAPEIAYVGTDGNVWRTPVPRGAAVRLTADAAPNSIVYSGLAWAPDGALLAALRQAGDPYTSPPTLVLLAPDGRVANRIRLPAPLVNTPFAWSPDGRRIAYRYRDPNTPQPADFTHETDTIGIVDVQSGARVATVNYDAGEVGCGGAFGAVTGEVFNLHYAYSGLDTFAWSPDQQSILVSYNCTNDAAIRIDLNSGKVSGGYPMGARYQPGGNLIVGLAERQNLVLTDANGKQVTALDSGQLGPDYLGGIGLASWSRDGKTIYFEHGVSIWRIGVDGSGASAIVAGNPPDNQQNTTVELLPALSPDGSLLLAVEVHGQDEVETGSASATWYVVAPDGTNRQPLATIVADAVWRPGA